MDRLNVRVSVQPAGCSTAATENAFSPIFRELQLIWPASPEKAIDNAVKDYRKQLACASQGWTF